MKLTVSKWVGHGCAQGISEVLIHSSLVQNIFCLPTSLCTSAVELIRSRVKKWTVFQACHMPSVEGYSSIKINPAQKLIAEKQWDLSKL